MTQYYCSACGSWFGESVAVYNMNGHAICPVCGDVDNVKEVRA